MPTTCVYKTINMVSGERFILPSGAEVVYTSNNSNVTSSCPDPLPTTPTKCFVFTWEANAVATDFADAYFTDLVLQDGLLIGINDPIGFPSNQYEDGGSEAEKLGQAMQQTANFPGTLIAFDQSGVTSLRQIKVSLPYFGKTPLLKLRQPNSGTGQIMYVEGTETDCSVPAGWTSF